MALHVFERALPLALTVFCGVIGGYYTFQPVFAPDALKQVDPPQITEAKSEASKTLPPPSK